MQSVNFTYGSGAQFPENSALRNCCTRSVQFDMSSRECGVCQKNATQACSACNSVYYCCKEHQKEHWKVHKNTCFCYKIERDEVMGRFVIATRNIKPGEVIMRSAPLLLGPKTVSSPLCLGCHKLLDVPFRYECKKCSFPLCGEKCEKSLSHVSECQVFSSAGYKPTVKADNSKQSVYSSVAPLRALLLKKNNPEKFKLLLQCQNHLDKHLTTPLYQILRRSLLPFFTSILNLDTTESEILTICSIFDTNCFQVRDPDGLVNIRGLYPTVSYLSHDCKHNTKHSFLGDDFTLVLTATTPIKKGELISTTYTHTLWNTLTRRAHLKMSKMFDCVCERCKDPTEFGTFVGSTVCNQCGEGKLMSLDSLDCDSDWSCDKCGFVVAGKDIVWGSKLLEREVAALDKSNPGSLEEFLGRFRGVLHEKNSFCLQVKYALTQMYGSIEGFKLNELSDELLERQIHLCKELLEVAEVLEPGLSRFRGLLLYDLHEALMEKVKRGEKNFEAEALGCLKEAGEILKLEPDLGDTVTEKMQNLLL